MPRGKRPSSAAIAEDTPKKARKPATLKMRVTQQPRKQGKTTFEVYSDYIALAMQADNMRSFAQLYPKALGWEEKPGVGWRPVQPKKNEFNLRKCKAEVMQWCMGERDCGVCV